ncbi:MAG: response regulator [Planctomycetaceae bacterium]|nr:MAG: response regulator [Planctomycetaceae bacterium]
MLVLSRREQESIVFPKLGIRIEVTRIRGKAISLGIEAPDAVRVLRGEIATPDDMMVDEGSASPEAETAGGTPILSPPSDPRAREREHELRNRINTLTIALHLLRKKASREDGLVDDELLNGAIDELSLIEETLQDSSAPADLDQVSKKASLPMALIVDDNANENALMAGFLRQCGFRVTVALDGESALQLLRQATRLPDIMLLDMNMPGLDGRATIEAIRSDPKTSGLRVFAVSGEDRNHCDVKVGNDGVDRWFQKPVRPDFLVREMANGIHETAPC